MADTQAVLKERGKVYGDFLSDATICQALKDVARRTPNWEHLQADQQQALEMVCMKMARILNGDPDYVDSWMDISGYAVLVVNRLEADAEHPVEALPFAGVSPKLLGNSEELSKPLSPE